MRKSIISLLVTGILLFVLGGGAWAYDFNDITKVQEWHYNSAYGSGTWKDRIGDINYFETFGANLSGNTFTIFSNWNPGKDGFLGVNTADLFIDNNSNGTFDYAIRLDTLTGTGNVYYSPTYLTSLTSQDVFSTTGYIYGGRYDESSPAAVPVFATSTSTGSTSVSWVYGSSNLDNRVVVDLSGLNLDSTWSFVWGTGTCSNDAISGNVQVPEPTTMLLLGLGLISLAGLRRKKI